jgi:hypothetical protein
MRYKLIVLEGSQGYGELWRTKFKLKTARITNNGQLPLANVEAAPHALTGSLIPGRAEQFPEFWMLSPVEMGHCIIVRGKHIPVIFRIILDAQS